MPAGGMCSSVYMPFSVGVCLHTGRLRGESMTLDVVADTDVTVQEIKVNSIFKSE